jgi:hypothetical protein
MFFSFFQFAPLKGAEEAELEPSSGFDVFLIFSICPPKKAEEAELEPSSGFDVFHFSRCSVISNSEHVRILPPSWGTLYQLTRLPVVPKLLDQARRILIEHTMNSEGRSDPRGARPKMGQGSGYWRTLAS